MIPKNNCVCCGLYCEAQKHHFLPRRIFGKNPWWKYLCQDCHEIADRVSLSVTSGKPEDYFRAFYNFVEERRRADATRSNRQNRLVYSSRRADA
jgi:uncharacterized protein YlaI